MAEPIRVRADDEVLGRLAAQAAGSVSEIVAQFSAIDQSLEGLRQHWAGVTYYEFYSHFEKTRADKDTALKPLETFCYETFVNVPKEYRQLESTIKTEVQKLQNGQV